MFEYFPSNYPWSLAVMIALGMGGEISEIDQACRPLRDIADDWGEEADRRWLESWSRLGRRLWSLAEHDERENRPWAAGRKYLRSATYLLLAERQVARKDDVTLSAYRAGLAAFRRGVELDGRNLEFVEVPFDNGAFPALFLPAAGAVAAPCVIQFDGLDVMKEILYLLHLYELPRYGISVLICDHPGVGEALRLRGLHLTPETERPAAACIDYLEGRDDVDASRIGLMALSLGGYYAPRAAAFERRIKACVVWGAIWDLAGLYQATKVDPRAPRSVDLDQAFASVFNVTTQQEIDDSTSLLNLRAFIDLVRCPMLTVHGENDRQAPVITAHKTHEGATNSSGRELKIFTADEGGSEHCQLDNVTMATDFIFAWLGKTLGSTYAHGEFAAEPRETPASRA